MGVGDAETELRWCCPDCPYVALVRGTWPGALAVFLLVVEVHGGEASP